MSNQVSVLTRIGAVALMSASVVACSTSGGPTPPATGAMTIDPDSVPAPNPDPGPPPDFNTAEYRRQDSLAQINALDAYDAGASGDGVVVSIIDTGIDVDNPEFAGRIHPLSADLIGPGVVPISEQRPGGPDLQDSDDHGTPVASIIGAARDDVGVHGVAPEVELLIFRADDQNDTETILGAGIAEGVDRSIAIGADVLNFSLGSDETGARSDFRQIFQMTAAGDIVTAVAAGNESDASPQLSALGAVDVVGGAATIVVGAVDRFNTIASYSNRAGEAADIFLVAPGNFIETTRVGNAPGELSFFSGTSAATPHVAGAAALIRDLWPQLSAQEVVDILLESAEDLGDPGTDEIYGRGLLDLAAAVQPSGAVTTTSASGATNIFAGFSTTLSSAFGAGLRELGDVVVLDQYGRDYRADLGSTVYSLGPDQFDLESTYNPFNRFEYASREIAPNLYAQMRLTSRDRTFSDFATYKAAAFNNAHIREDLVEDSISVSLTQDLGVAGSLTIAQGFDARSVDRMGVQSRATPFIGRSAFTDAYLPEASNAITAMMKTPLGDGLSADFLVSRVDLTEDDDNGFIFEPGREFSEKAAASIRAGINFALPQAVIRFEQGLRRETGSILNATFGDEAVASTIYSAFETDWRFHPKWRLKGRYATGFTFADTNGLGGFVDEISDLTSSQFSVALARDDLFDTGDAFWLGVSQPLHVDAGSLRVTLPTDYDAATDSLIFSSLSTSLANTARPVDIEAGYRLVAGPFGAVDLSLLHQTFDDDAIEDLTTFLVRSGFQF